MVDAPVRSTPGPDLAIDARIAESARSVDNLADPSDLDKWLADCGARFFTDTSPVPLAELVGWRVDSDTGNLVHDTGRFFRVEGLDVQIPGAPIEQWSQPIINQPEVGILGILVKEFDGVLHCLMQAKAEPGNSNGIQVSPTVQATRSNYTGVHGGRPVPYLDHFRSAERHHVITDVRQSEQGAWFRHKRNRNMVVETTADIDVLDGFRWMTLAELHRLLRVDHLVNMDTRTVLSCLPLSGARLAEAHGSGGAGSVPLALARSYDPAHSGAHPMNEILSWITDARTRYDMNTTSIPLRWVRDWRHVDGRIRHDRGLFFDVVGVAVQAAGREVGRWQQPMIAPHGTGLVAVLVREIDGVLHALMHTRVEPGYFDVLELAPTVQCNPHTCERLGGHVRPRFLDDVLAAAPDRILFDAVHSEEGGRFLNAHTRYMVVSTDDDSAPEQHPDYRWLTLHQLHALLQHSHYLNVQARSVVACLHSLVTGWSAGTAGTAS